MEPIKLKSDQSLHEAFGIILSIETFNNYISEIAELIYNDKLCKESLNNILDIHNINRIDDIKEELLDLLIVYTNLMLNDHIIAENEKRNLGLLKIRFKIKEGDFFKLRYEELQDIITRQFEMLYSDNIIDFKEAIYAGGLQEIFDLSYDQIDKFKESNVFLALERGANIMNLNTANIPERLNPNSILGQEISQHVKDIVWNRDNGQCKKCGNRENVEFDHIIPLSKGGSNTYRNIQLLCSSCKKTDDIG